MHTHGTAVLPGTAEATPISTTGASARDRWLAKCTEDAAKTLATRNADLLPVLPALVFVPIPDRCPDCHGTGYSHDDFDLCSCMGRSRPAYDFPRYSSRDEAGLMMIGTSRQTPAGQLDAWVPCQHCGIIPTMAGPYSGHDLIRAPWVPDCTTCNDTGWAFARHLPAGYEPW